MLTALLRQILAQAAESSDHGPSPRLLEALWPHLAGDALARHTRPLRYDEGVLHLAVESDAWQRELERNQRLLVNQLATAMPWRLDRIELHVAAGAVSRPATHHHAQPSQRQPARPTLDRAVTVQSPPVLPPLDPDADRALEDLDADLRASLLRIRAQALARDGGTGTGGGDAASLRPDTERRDRQ